MSWEVTRHHESGRICALCDAKLFSAHPYLRKWFNESKQTWPNLHISWAFRDENNQNKCYDEGTSKKRWPNSAHNFVSAGNLPCAKALDVFQIDEDGLGRFSWPFYQKLWGWSQGKDYSLRWGGTFKDLGDAGHFEIDPRKPLTMPDIPIKPTSA